ncbi:hypothetical protein N0V82_004411 [Gnomoniopsis sp. IMI 355080]|nr:hypothetical protein N0V82_004411 [Gnomoniopsis sp. IMI 355080]
MADLKKTQPKEHEEEAAAAGDDGLPEYEASAPGPSSSRPRAASDHNQGPTLNDPFNFPSNSGLPPYSETARIVKPVAIPQSRPDPAAPFIDAYAPTLTSRGITPETWYSFIKTMSAFLTAKVSDKAIAHAGDIGRQLGSGPISFGKGVARNAKTVGQHIKSNAKRGNVVGTALGVVGGAISLSVGTVFSAVGTIVSLPASAVGAVAKKPHTPVERAAAYAAVANKDWLNARGLYAQILDTQQLCRLIGLSDPRQLIESASEQGKAESAAGQLKRLSQYLCELQLKNDGELELGGNTLWLVVNQTSQ